MQPEHGQATRSGCTARGQSGAGYEYHALQTITEAFKILKPPVLAAQRVVKAGRVMNTTRCRPLPRLSRSVQLNGGGRRPRATPARLQSPASPAVVRRQASDAPQSLLGPPFPVPS